MGLASGALVIGTTFVSCETQASVPAGPSFEPNLFVELKPDGTLVLLCSRSEMGQGIRSSITAIIADEMEADISKVEIKQAIGDERLGNQNTDGSRSIRNFYDTMRMLGATTKAVLIQAAANTWAVNPSECRAENHKVVHPMSGQELGFGELVETARELQVPATADLKDKKDFKFIGKKLKNKDLGAFLNGSATFGIDIRLPGMVYAAIARCPVAFGTLKSFDDTEARKMYGVLDVFEIPPIDRAFGCLGGVVVLATNTWSAFQAKDALKIEWEYGENRDYDTDSFISDLKSRLDSDEALLVNEEGDVDAYFKKANKIVEATYSIPHLAHAPMEVPNATALVKADSCEIYAPVQNPQSVQEELEALLGFSKENIVVNVSFLGGGFGRKSKCDFVVEAAWISRKIDKPVQVVWSREDDLRHAYYHANSTSYLKASLNDKGQAEAWLHSSAAPSIASTFNKGADQSASWEMGQGMTSIHYDVKAKRFVNPSAKAHVRIGWLRSVYSIVHSHSVNVFVDELARAAERDILDFRLEMIGPDRFYPEIPAGEEAGKHAFHTARLKYVLQEAAKSINYGADLDEGEGIGLAEHYSFRSYVASAVKVKMVDGKVKVKEIHTVIDCGQVVNMDAVLNQIEGSAIFGMSIALHSKITAKDGRIEQSNFHDYVLTRIDELPEIKVTVVDSEAAPAGVGEPGVPPIAPAIINAIADATGVYHRDLPLADHGLV